MPVGQANPVSMLDDPCGAIKVFRLRVACHELPGRWICKAREFVRLVDDAPEARPRVLVDSK